MLSLSKLRRCFATTLSLPTWQLRTMPVRTGMGLPIGYALSAPITKRAAAPNKVSKKQHIA